jgi:hypothetical protein
MVPDAAATNEDLVSTGVNVSLDKENGKYENGSD